MKLKEAQMLGILAVIAVGIILLCMWGSRDSGNAERLATEERASAEVASEPTVAELASQLQAPSVPTSQGAKKDSAATMAVVARPQGAPGEKAAIETIIDKAKPAEIGLAPAAAPAPPAAAAPAVGQPQPSTHVVQRGETLASIAQKYYGSSAKWTVIHEANKAVVPDPRRLAVNTKLVIPPASGAPAAQPVASAPSSEAASSPVLSASTEAATGRVYTVQRGDSLFRIAQRHYGDGSRYKDILAANQNVLRRPEDLQPGMKLVIP